MLVVFGGEMGREVRVALGAVAGIAALVIGFIFLIRYAVPAILEAHFAGSLITASVVGIAGMLALCWAAWRLYVWASRALGVSDNVSGADQ
jgi:protein-S-isoprenylcysteine O-methyltransferase Ste14